MSFSVAATPEAAQDIDEAFDWYEEHQPQLGESFISSVDRTFERIAHFPDAFPIAGHGVRKAPVERFPYWVFYFRNGPDVWVLGVVHERRSPECWQRRV